MAPPSLMTIITLTLLAILAHQLRGETATWKKYPIAGKQYIDLNKPWDQPDGNKEACADIGGFLPEPNDQVENDFLVKLNAVQFRLGMTGSGANWRWLRDGSQVTWFNWGDHVPSSRGENCVVMSGGTWTDTRCSGLFGTQNVVCEKATWQTDPNTGKQYIDLDQSWVPPDGNKEACAEIGGFLPEPNNEVENGFLVKMNALQFRLGMTGSEADWRWLRDGSQVTWFNWTRPPIAYGVNCAVMTGASWTETRCSSLLGTQNVVCENECSNGTFGRRCSDCHCQDVCDKVTGRCPADCEDGWRGDDCQQENITELLSTTPNSTTWLEASTTPLTAPAIASVNNSTIHTTTVHGVNTTANATPTDECPRHVTTDKLAPLGVAVVAAVVSVFLIVSCYFRKGFKLYMERKLTERMAKRPRKKVATRDQKIQTDNNRILQETFIDIMTLARKRKFQQQQPSTNTGTETTGYVTGSAASSSLTYTTGYTSGYETYVTSAYPTTMTSYTQTMTPATQSNTTFVSSDWSTSIW